MTQPTKIERLKRKLAERCVDLGEARMDEGDVRAVIEKWESDLKPSKFCCHNEVCGCHKRHSIVLKAEVEKLMRKIECVRRACDKNMWCKNHEEIILFAKRLGVKG